MKKYMVSRKRGFLRACMGTWVAMVLVTLMTVAPAPALAAPAAGEGSVEVTVRVAGVDDPQAEEPFATAWVSERQQTVESGTVAWDALKAALDEAGCTYDAQDSEYGVFVQSITSPEGMALENTSSEPYSFWAFLVNGEMATEGVSAYVLQDGDTVELAYYPGGEAPAHEPMPIDDGATDAPVADAPVADALAADGAEPEAEGEGPNMMPLALGGVAVVVIAVAVVVLVRARSKR